MTINLPTRGRLELESEAQAYANRRWLEYHHGDNRWSDDPFVSKEASRALVRHIMRLGALRDPRGEMHVIAVARAGDPDADLVVRDIALEKRSRGEVLSPWLEAYIFDRAEGFLQRPARKKKNNLLRDLIIAVIVAELEDRFEINGYGRSPHRRSGCAIVGAVVGLSYDDIKTIWDKHKRHMPTKRGWARG
jgi:hypothetical protein